MLSSGDFFLHFLDSPEQALLVIPIFSDIVPRGGGTYINPSGITAIAKHLAAHPEGVQPGMGAGDGRFDFLARVREAGDDDFVELTGEVGDVILMHPLMLHSASRNNLRIPRILTNPPVRGRIVKRMGIPPILTQVSLHFQVSLKEPFEFDRPEREDYSLVELKTLKALGDLDRLDFKPGVPRRRIVPAAWAVKDEKKKRELERLRAHAIVNGYPVPDICQPGYEIPLINGGL